MPHSRYQSAGSGERVESVASVDDSIEAGDFELSGYGLRPVILQREALLKKKLNARGRRVPHMLVLRRSLASMLD